MNFRGLPFFRSLSFAAVVAASSFSFAHAQDVNSAIAGMREDIRILDERTRSLTAEIEQLKRENAALRSQAAGSYATVAQLNNAINEVEKAVRAGDQQTVLQLTKEVEKLARATQASLDAIQKNAGATRGPGPTTVFTDDWPKTGVSYTVQPGDTLAGIAARFKARVEDIKNANKIADPRSLQAGQSLFIPQRQ